MNANINTDDFDIYRRHMVNNSSGSDDDNKNNEIMKLHVYQVTALAQLFFWLILVSDHNNSKPYSIKPNFA